MRSSTGEKMDRLSDVPRHVPVTSTGEADGADEVAQPAMSPKRTTTVIPAICPMLAAFPGLAGGAHGDTVEHGGGIIQRDYLLVNFDDHGRPA